MFLRKKLLVLFIISISIFSNTMIGSALIDNHWSNGLYGKNMNLFYDNPSNYQNFPDDPINLSNAIDRLINALFPSDVSSEHFSSFQLDNLEYRRECTREEFFALVGREFSVESDETDKLNEFSDANEVSDEARPYLCGLINAGVILGNGDGTLMPRKMLSKAETVAFSLRFIDYYNNRQRVEISKTAFNFSVCQTEYDDTTGIARAGKELELQHSGSEPNGYVKPVIYNCNIEVLNFVTGIYRFTLNNGDVLLDDGAEYWIFWESLDGTFGELSGDCRSVVFYAGLHTAERNATISIVVVDSFGNRHSRKVNVKGNDSHYLLDEIE